MTDVLEVARRARAAAVDLRTLTRDQKDAALRAMADALDDAIPALVAANAVDVERADDEVAETLRAGSDVYAKDVIKLVREAQRDGLLPDGDARLYATGVLGTVSSFGHALRSGSLETNPTDLATFVGDWVVRALVGDALTQQRR